MTIGFIGLGVMGKPMAENLLKAGYALKVFDLVPQAVSYMKERGATVSESTCQAAENTDVVITMLPDGPQVKTVVLGENGIAEVMRKGSLLLDMSSISPVDSVEIAEALKEKGIRMLDAPVSGAYAKAVDGTLSIMVGGLDEDFEEMKPILDVMGGSITHIGPAGSGSACKLTNQIIIASGIAAIGEAFMLAKKQGCDLERVFNAVKSGFAGSTLMNSTVPRMLQGNYEPGFRIDLHLKDIRNAVKAGEACGAPIPFAKHMLEVLTQLHDEGDGSLDNSGIVRYYERLTGLEFRSEDK